MSDPRMVTMSDTLAQALGIPVVPFKDGKPVAPAVPLSSIIVQAVDTNGAVFWRFWPIDPLAMEGAT